MLFFIVTFTICDYQSFLFLIIVYKVGRVFFKKKSRALKGTREDPRTSINRKCNGGTSGGDIMSCYKSLLCGIIFHIGIRFHIFSAAPFHSQKLAAHKDTSGPIMHARDPKSERIHLASQEPLTRSDLVSLSGLKWNSENISTQNRNCNLEEIVFLFY